MAEWWALLVDDKPFELVRDDPHGAAPQSVSDPRCRDIARRKLRRMADRNSPALHRERVYLGFVTSIELDFAWQDHTRQVGNSTSRRWKESLRDAQD